jgi:hypothetical protein
MTTSGSPADFWCRPSKFSIQTKMMISNAAGHNIIVLAAARNGNITSTE